MSLSKERLRIAEASHLVGKFSGLDYQQAKVDFNAEIIRIQAIKSIEHEIHIFMFSSFFIAYFKRKRKKRKDLRFSPFPYVAPGGHFQQQRMPLPWLP